MKAQSALEFLATYSWSFLILAIFVSIMALITTSPTPGTSSYLPSSCYIEPELPCFQAIMLTNTVTPASKFVILIQNNLGTSMYFPTYPLNSITVNPSLYSNFTFNGVCLPQNALPGSTVFCNATTANYLTVAGAQLSPKFTISYKLCTPVCGSQIYNTSGSSVVVATPYNSVLFTVQLLSAPNAPPTAGQISLSGVKYSNGANVIMISGLNYQIYAVPPPGHTFVKWIATGNILVGSLTSQSTTVNAIGFGSLSGNFV